VFARPGRVKRWMSRLAGARQGYRHRRAKERIRRSVLWLRTPICVLVSLPGPPAAGEGRRGGGGGGGKTTRSCIHGGEHHLTEVPDECRAAPLVDLTCAHVRTQRFSLSVCECYVLFPLHSDRCTILDWIVCVCVCVCVRARACCV